MKTLLIILGIIAGVLIVLPILIAVSSLVYHIFLLATGKMTKKQLADTVAANKEKEIARKKLKGQYQLGENSKKSRSGAFHHLSYPSPLNNWGLWHR